MNALRQGRYRAKKLRVLDPSANKDKIREIYLNCPAGFEVDHIVPLSRGGKHHEDNLQYLTIEENRRKNNRMMVGPEGLEPPP
jgi:5-methylcytosine-specific restriction endonuclease McrA